MKFLTPHGPGFSFVDHFQLLDAGQKGRATKWLDPSLAFFQDHFPGAPLMPGVFLIESAAQTAGLLWGESLALTAQPRFVLAQVNLFKIQRSVFPGQTMEITAQLEKDFGTLAQFSVEIRESEELVATGRLVLSRPAA